MSGKGYLAVILHAHLPYVRHPEYPRFLEECWLFEAITESYLPLLEALERLESESIPFRLTLSLSPPLVTMLSDPLLQQRYREHLDRLDDLISTEQRRCRGHARLAAVTDMYRERVATARKRYDALEAGDLPGAFCRLRDQGCLELITTTATHGFLPLMRHVPGAIRSQIAVGAQQFEDTFGSRSPGLWLPECGYFPGLERAVAEAGFRYVVLDTHGVVQALPEGGRDPRLPIRCPNGIVALGRDPLASRLVWSADLGYPGDACYREFHRDIGLELPRHALTAWIGDSGPRYPSGLKYYRVSDTGQPPSPYAPEPARLRALEHANDFIESLHRSLREESQAPSGRTVITAPFDAELFGHWWYEGPMWLEEVLRLAAASERLQTVAPSDILDPGGTSLPTATPVASSWGEGGYNRPWLNPDTAWIYPLLRDAATQMQQLVRYHSRGSGDDMTRRALRQAARSLLLSQASDWPFLIRSGTAAAYAEKRLRDHLARFHHLEQGIRRGTLDTRTLEAVEYLDRIFPEIDWRLFA